MSRERPKLTAIIVNWNTKDLLRGCLTSLFERTQIPLEVIVVDNASSDSSAAMVREEFGDILLIENDENRGFAAANNQAIRLARGRYLLLLNPDTVTQPGALKGMIRFLDEHPDAGVVGPELLWPDGAVQGGAAGYNPSLVTIFSHSYLLSKLFPRFFRGLWLHSQHYGEGAMEVDWISGACLMARAEAVREVGLLDEGYFMYAEDMEWCYRMRRRGWRVYYLPSVQVTHYSRGSSKQRGYGFVAKGIKSLDSYYRSQNGTLMVVLFHLVGICGFLLRFLIYSTLYLVKQEDLYREQSLIWKECARISLACMLGRGTW